jgi:internalin A
LEPDVRQIWIRKSLDRRDYEQIGAICSGRDDLHLFTQNQDEDLSILEAFPALRSFEVTSLRLKSLAGLEHAAASLESLTISDTLKTVRLEPLGQLENLRHLYIDGHRNGIEAIGNLARLERLTLRAVTLPDLSLLCPLKNLWWFDLKLGGTRDLGLLPDVGQLRYLEIWRVRGVSDLEAVASLPLLENLHLQSMGGVTGLPTFASSSSLRRVSLESMKGIANLACIAAAPALEDLFLVEMGHLEPDAVAPFVGHPTLKAAVLGLGSRSKNEAAAALLPLPHPGEFEFSG